MLFNSLTFLVFFAVVLALHNLPLSWTLKKINLLVASYLFYAAWNPPFVLLLILAAGVDFVLAHVLERTESPCWRRAVLVTSLTLNLGLLGFFKYGAFLSKNAAAVCGWFGMSPAIGFPDVILPLGISFYTFETISYLVDVYRRKTRAWDSFLDYALFLTFFPHLVAGPIVRANDFLPQCRTPRRATADQMGWGFALLVLGLFEKMILADQLLRPVVDQVYGRMPRPPAAMPGWAPSPSPGKFSLISRATRPVRSAWRCAWGSCSRTTSISRTRRSGSPISGVAGTSRSRRGCATTCISPWAAIGMVPPGPTRT